MKSPFTVAGIALVLLGQIGYAAEHEGVKMADQVEVGGKSLVLNGLGARKATMFKVVVYVGGLYLPAKTSDAKTILASNDPKLVRLEMKRDVSADQFRDAFKESFKKHCGDPCKEAEQSIKKLFGSLQDVKRGQIVEFAFEPEQVTFSIANQKIETFSGEPTFGPLLLKSWIGDHPPNPELKKGMLGK